MRKATSFVCAIVLAAVISSFAASSGSADEPAPTWSSAASMPTARWNSGVASTLDGDIVVFGGSTSSAITGAVERYSPGANTWSTLASMPTPRTDVAAVTAANGIIYLVGGFPVGADAANTVEAFDPSANSWSTRAGLPSNAAGAAGVRGPDGTIYMIGGYPGCCFGYLNTVYAYDEVSNSWSSRAPMPTPRQGPGAALAADGKIYVVGGNGTGPIDRVVEAYNPATNTWETKAPMPIGNSNVSLAAAPNGKLYAFGYNETGAVLEYETTADTWTAVAPLPTPRDYIAGALGGDGSIYAIGGRMQPSGQITAVTERASFTSEPFVPVYNVAVNTKASSTNQSITSTAGVTVPAGDTVTVSVATGTFAGPVGCTDSKGNPYNVVADKNTGNGRLFICSASVVTALTAGDIVTANYPGFSGLSVVSVNAISAAMGTGAVGQTSVNAGNSPSPTSGNITTSQPAALLFGVIAHNSVPTLTAGPGFTIIGTVTGGSGSGTRTLTPEYMTITSGTYAVTGTLSGGQQWRAAAIEYQPTAT